MEIKELTFRVFDAIRQREFWDNLQRIQSAEEETREACRQRLYGDDQITQQLTETGIQKAIKTLNVAIRTGRLNLDE